MTRLLHCLRDFSDQQSQLFLMVGAFLIGYEAPDLHALIDQDVDEATGAMAATFETAARGVVYQHRPASPPADRLAAALSPLFEAARGTAETAFERDAAVVLRRVQQAVQN
jgi:hypothetical protein